MYSGDVLVSGEDKTKNMGNVINDDVFVNRFPFSIKTKKEINYKYMHILGILAKNG